MSREPVRWLDRAEQPELLHLMRAGAEELAPPEVLARVGERLSGAAPASADVPARPRSHGESLPVPGTTIGLGVKVFALVVLLGLTGLSVFVLSRARPSAPVHPSRPAERAHATLPDAAHAAPAALDQGPGAPTDRSSTVAPPPDPAAHPATEHESERRPRAQRARASAPRLASEASAKSETRLMEAKLLEQARRELSSRPNHALALLREHVTQFPASWLEEERTALLIRALAETGQRAEARALLTQFQAQFPGSLHTARLAQSLATP
jgi:hypothetical protein